MTNDKIYKKTIVAFVLVFVISTLFVQIAQAVQTQTSEPGSDGDPIVTRSYVDASVSDAESELAALQEEIKNLKASLSGGAGESKGFVVVTIEAGTIFYTGNGTEIVLRSGTAKAVVGEYGGLSDVTSAKDLAKGAAVSLNHLVISSRDDGRGLSSVTKCYVLVRGSYTMKSQQTTSTGSGTTNQGETAKTGTISVLKLNVREKPETTASVVTQVAQGETVTILSQSGDWYNVKTSKGITGWTMAKYVSLE